MRNFLTPSIRPSTRRQDPRGPHRTSRRRVRQKSRRPQVIPHVKCINQDAWQVTWPGCAPFECNSATLCSMIREMPPAAQNQLLNSFNK
jgi:hypothetical protein